MILLKPITKLNRRVLFYGISKILEKIEDESPYYKVYIDEYDALKRFRYLIEF